MTQITENFEFQKLMDYDESGTLSGPMSPMMAANAIAKEFDIKFTGLVRWIYGENYDYLIMRRRYKNGRWFGLFIDMGVSITPVGQWFWKDDGSGDEFAMTTPLYRKMLTPEAQKEHYANCEKDERYDDPPIIELTDQTLTAMFRACEKQGDWKLNNKNYDDLGRVIKDETIVSEDIPEYGQLIPKAKIEGDCYHIVCPKCGNWEDNPIDQQRHHLQSFEMREMLNLPERDIAMMRCDICDHLYLLDWEAPDNTVAVWDLRTDLRDMPESSQIEMYFALKDARDKLNGLNENTEALTSIIRQIISYNQNLENINDR
jgi:hypothetical protein